MQNISVEIIAFQPGLPHQMIINNDCSKFNNTLYLKYYHLRIQRGARFVSTVSAASFLR